MCNKPFHIHLRGRECVHTKPKTPLFSSCLFNTVVYLDFTFTVDISRTPVRKSYTTYTYHHLIPCVCVSSAVEHYSRALISGQRTRFFISVHRHKPLPTKQSPDRRRSPQESCRLESTSEGCSIFFHIQLLKQHLFSITCLRH